MISLWLSDCGNQAAQGSGGTETPAADPLIAVYSMKFNTKSGFCEYQKIMLLMYRILDRQ